MLLNAINAKMPTSPRFLGTGKDGTPRVVAIKANYTEQNYDAFRQRRDIQFDGFASDQQSAAKLLAEKQPDVILAGSTFGDGTIPPLDMAIAYIKALRESGVTKLPAVILHSQFSVKDAEWYRQEIHRQTGIPLEALPTIEHVSTRSTDDELANAVKRLDPFKA